MNILQVINKFMVGGAERLLSDYIPLMAQHHHVEVLTLQEEDSHFVGKLREAGIQVHCLHLRHLYSPLAIWSIRRFLKRNPQYDVLHVHLFPSQYWVPLAAIGLNMKLVWTEHNTFNRRWNIPWLRPIEKKIYALYDKIICISPATLEATMAWTQAQPSDARYCVIENGVDISRFRKAAVAKPYPHCLIQVSRFEEQKDQDTVIRALKLLDEDIHVMFVGVGTRLQQCQQLAEELGVQHRAHFLGIRNDIRELLSSADIGVISSHWEGFGLVAVEAMANGLPVIASDVDGLKQVVEGAGLLFPAGDVNALAEHVRAVLSDKSLYEELSQKSLGRAEKYDISTMCNNYIKVYEDILM